MELLLSIIIILSLPGYPLFQWYVVRNWDGGWRIAALVPLFLMVPLVIHAGVAFLAESNLWPLMVILVTPLACFYLIALASVRAVVR
jgi:hypothetical protein